jgi:hypothetical protein
MSNPNHDEELSAQAAAELEDGNRDEGLWAKCFAECDGEENRAKARYIKTRAERLAVGESLINPKDVWKGEPAVVAEPETKPEEEDWEAWCKRQADVERAWQTPGIITWVTAIVIWYLLNNFVIRQTFNPHFPDPDRHEWYDEEGKYYLDDWAVLVGSSHSVNKWRDPKTRKVYTWKHPAVISGLRWERIVRSLSTFLCCLPIALFYYMRIRQYESNPAILQKALLQGFLCCAGVGLAMYFGYLYAPDIVRTISGLLCCGAIVLPFFLWPKRHLLFGKKKADRTEY